MAYVEMMEFSQAVQHVQQDIQMDPICSVGVDIGDVTKVLPRSFCTLCSM